MYHRDSCETAEDAINDLVEYCYRKLCYLISRFGHICSPVAQFRLSITWLFRNDWPPYSVYVFAAQFSQLCTTVFFQLVKVNQVWHNSGAVPCGTSDVTTKTALYVHHLGVCVLFVFFCKCYEKWHSLKNLMTKVQWVCLRADITLYKSDHHLPEMTVWVAGHGSPSTNQLLFLTEILMKMTLRTLYKGVSIWLKHHKLPQWM